MGSYKCSHKSLIWVVTRIVTLRCLRGDAMEILVLEGVAQIE